jgi:uncharacterized protein YndB with AHSA1/START domain
VSLLSCELDARTGGTYRLVFASETIREIAFYGMYLEVPAHSRIVWTKDEGGEGGTITTVAFEEKAGQTLLVIRDLYPTKRGPRDWSRLGIPRRHARDHGPARRADRQPEREPDLGATARPLTFSRRVEKTRGRENERQRLRARAASFGMAQCMVSGGATPWGIGESSR